METMIGGPVVARALKRLGTSCVFTLCGGHVAPIYDGCLSEGIDIIDVRHEQAAAHAADAWARLTRGPGVAIVTAGPGVTDAVTGVAPALRAALASDEVTCIDVPIDPDFMVRSGLTKLSV